MILSKPWHKLNVVFVESMRFRVESESHAAPHLVDMAENKGQGQCSCKDFGCRAKLRQHHNAPDELNPCKHILRTAHFLGQQVVAKFLEDKRNKPHDGP